MPLVSLLGVPWDGSSSFQRGAAAAPQAIRRALWSASSSTWNERGDDLAAPGILADAGDLDLGDDPGVARALIESRVRDILGAGHRPLILGGDHSITFPVLRAFAGRTDRLTILHFDAHADLYDSFPGRAQGEQGDQGENESKEDRLPDLRELPVGFPRGAASGSADETRYSHACPFARIMEERIAARVVQIGVRTLTAHLRSQAAKFGVEILGADRWRDAVPLVARLRGSVYLSLDLDVLEPMLAPGLSHPEPGGLTVREVLDVLAAISATIVGADVVEYNPRNDVRDLTARVAAKFVKEIVGLLRR